MAAIAQTEVSQPEATAARFPKTGTAQGPPAQAATHRIRAGANGFGAPALLMAVSFAGGILLTQYRWIAPGWLLAGAVLAGVVAAVACLWAERMAFAAAAAACVLLGAFCAEVQPRPPARTPLMRIADATPAATPALHRRGIVTAHEISGSIVRAGPVRQIETTAPYSDRIRRETSQQVDVRVTAVDGAPLPAAEGLRLTVYAAEGERFPALRCSGLVRMSAEIHTQERFLDPGVWDAGAWLRSQNVSALGSARAANVIAAGTISEWNGACRVHALQQVVSERLVAFTERPGPRWMPAAMSLSHEDGAMLTAMLTGDRTLLGHTLRAGFERTGSFHLLVVSGLHLAIFSGVVFWTARRMRLPRVWASLATAALSLGYAVFTGFGQPVQRAFWMIALYLTGRLLWRERHAMNAIGFAALTMLSLDPKALMDAGFQMTLLSVLAVAGVAVPVAEKSFGPYLRATRNLRLPALDAALPPRVAQFRVTLRMMGDSLQRIAGKFAGRKALPWSVRLLLTGLELLTTSLAIEMLMALPMAVYFHRVTAVALPVNILIVPLLGFLLPLALLMLLLVLMVPAAAPLPAAAVALLLHGVSGLVRVFGGMRFGDLRIAGPTLRETLAAVLLVATALALMRMRRLGTTAAALALVVAAVTTMLPRPVTHRGGTLEVSVLDVGQGDSLLVITPHGRTLLIDAGGLVGGAAGTANAGASDRSRFDIGEDVVSPVLWSRGIRRLDAVAITHAHADHIGGMPAVIRNFRPRELWVGRNPHSAAYDAILAEAEELHTRVIAHQAGDVFLLDEVRIRALAPAAGYQPAATPGNNDSLVLQMQFQGKTALLEGDAEVESERQMLAEGGLHADLLKVGHHGSRTSTTPEFLAAVSPSWAAISVGRRNFYGHPRHEILEELQGVHTRTFRTDMTGLTTFYLDRNGVWATGWDHY